MLGAWRGRTDHPPVKVLHAARLGNVARHAEVEEDVVHVGVFGGGEPAKDDEAPAVVDGLGDLVETGAQGGEGEGCLVDVVGGEVGESCQRGSMLVEAGWCC